MMSIDEYLERLAVNVDDKYAKQFRSQFKDILGTSELAMLASPSLDELVELRRAVAIMTSREKDSAAGLSDEQVKQIADDAKVDLGILAIFINGYSIYISQQEKLSKG